MKFLISTYTNPVQVVMDNTMGSGTTGIACLQLNRRFLGVEQDETIFDTAEARLYAELIQLNTPDPQMDMFARSSLEPVKTLWSETELL
jgi:site-specific DNA-methyltransferase (adenine-specific)